MIFILSVIGEMTLDIGPGEVIWIAAGLCPGIVVAVKVGCVVGVRVGNGVFVGGIIGIDAIAVSVDETIAESAVSAITVGKYSGG